MTYEEALKEARRVGASRADDRALMAVFCQDTLQLIVGAVSPKLVWEGAQHSGLTSQQLLRLASTDVMAVSNLQWVSA